MPQELASTKTSGMVSGCTVQHGILDTGGS
jgi:hypothetical protein